MLGLSLLLLPWPLPIIPRPVLNGYFLYLGVTYLSNKQIIDRTLLLITEQVSTFEKNFIHNFKFTSNLHILLGFFFLCTGCLSTQPLHQASTPERDAQIHSPATVSAAPALLLCSCACCIHSDVLPIWHYFSHFHQVTKFLFLYLKN